MNPPWIIFNFVVLWLGLLSDAVDPEPQLQESNSTTKERFERQIQERERRLVPYMTFYVAHSVRNPKSGERQNVLIPLQTQEQKVERANTAPQVQVNNIQNVPQPQRYEIPVTQPVTVRFQENDFYPTPSIELTPKQEFKDNRDELRVLSQVYRFKSPGPQSHQRPQQQQSLAPQPLLRPAYQQVPIRPQINQKYPEPQVVKFIPYNPNYNQGFHPQYLLATPRPQLTYTSTKLQDLVNNPYGQTDQNYYKGSGRTVVDTTYIPGKIYAVNIIPQTAPKIAVQSLRPRPNPERANLNQVFIGSTTPAPYRTQVKFELEDARVPSSLNALQLEKVQDPTPLTYPTESISTNYINTQGQITEPPKKEEHNVYFNHQIAQERPSHVRFVPVRAQSQSLTPETIRIEQVAPIQSTPVSQVDQIEIVQENTPGSQAHETNDISQGPQDVGYDYDATKVVQPEPKPSLDTSVVNLLTILKQTNQLPQNFTPENIDNSIKTLALILERLQSERNFQTFSTASKTKTKPKPTAVTIITEEKPKKLHSYPSPSGTSTPGRPGIDYPTYATIPQTQFDCATQRYKGFFGDPDTNCQVWHYCDLNGGQASFLCPNGTIFSQVALTCDWWFNVKCASTSQLYVLNERLYKYILPFSPSFPEDYSGPLVDRYLAAKFKEMEAKSKLKALKELISTSKPETSVSSTTPAETTPAYNGQTE